MRRPSRRRGARGFALAEALVALAVAAMTLSLLTAATWGLRQASERRAALEISGAADWLTARRALGAWAAGLNAETAQGAEGRILGTATQLRLVVDDAPPHTAELRVEDRGEGRFALIALRHMGQRDARLAVGDALQTVLVETDEPIRLQYLTRGEGGLDWRYETGVDLPNAVAVEVGDARRLTAAIHPTRGAACLAAFGLQGLEEPRCALR